MSQLKITRIDAGTKAIFLSDIPVPGPERVLTLPGQSFSVLEMTSPVSASYASGAIAGMVARGVILAELTDEPPALSRQIKPPSGKAGGGLGGSYPNPTVERFSIVGQEVGSVLYFDGTDWVQLPPDTATYVLTSQGPGLPPIWAESGGSSAYVQRGDFDAFTAYAVNDVVNHLGSSYVAITPSTGSAPPSLNWSLVASKGDPGTAGPAGPAGPAGTVTTVNGASVTSIDLDDATPTAPAGGRNLTWQKDGSSPVNVSGHVPGADASTPGVVQLAGDLAGTATSPQVAQARGLRTAGGVTFPMGNPTEGQTLRIVGGLIVGAVIVLGIAPSSEILDLNASSVLIPGPETSIGEPA